MASKGLSLQMRYVNGKFKNRGFFLELVDRSRYTCDKLREIRKEAHNFIGELRR